MNNAKRKPARLFLDQYGNHVWARSVKDLREQAGGRVSKMYQDRRDGTSVHVGYVVGARWFTEYAPVERPA